jgi:hypothetical protein
MRLNDFVWNLSNHQPNATGKNVRLFLKMKIHAFKKNTFTATVLAAALCACLLPQSSVAQIQPASDDSAQPVVPDTLPADILPSSQLAQVIKLAQAGVGESIILTYINNSAGTFNLTSDQIIYLKDIGLPDDAVTAMMQRDQQLGATAAQTPPSTIEAATVQPVAVTQNYFYDTLSPYGGWVDVEGYGRCWRPTVVVYDSSWQPYCNHGHWVYTDAGWYWVSDYSWGECAFHYGRWFHDARFGWCWWPDTAWAPSWVCWRYSDDYCGWAPLPPRCVYREGVGIVYNGAVVSAGFDFGISVNFFTFVPTRNFCDPHPERFRVSHDRAPVIYNQTTIINNFNVNSRDHTVINAGIAPERITAVTRTPVPRLTIRETSAPDRHGKQLDRGTLIVNRPHFDNTDPAAPLHQNVLPHPVPANRPNTPRPPDMNESRNNPGSAPHNLPPQNNFSQPGMNRNPQPGQPETPRGPQDRSGDSPAHQTPVPNPAPGTPFQTPAADFNSRQPIQTQPRQQPEQTGTPRTFTHNPDAPQNVNTSPQNPVAPPAANHLAPPPQQPQQPPPIVQPPAQIPAAPATAPAQKNSGKQDKNQNGQQQ